MNALDLPSSTHGPIELAALASPAVLMEPARLYATVSDDAGKASPWRFLADLPAGSAVFALAAPGASFLLTARAAAIAPQLGSAAPDAAAIGIWFAALLSCAGVPRGDGEALPLEAGERRSSGCRQPGDRPPDRLAAKRRTGPALSANGRTLDRSRRARCWPWPIR